MRYDGFISYSHAADGKLAPAVQGALQRFAKPWHRRRALTVFRDSTGLSVAPHLWAAVSDAMDDSEWFVLLTSPDAAQSRWVNREIEHWLDTRPVERMLPVVTAGEWVWDESSGDFDWSRSTAVPAALAGVYTDEPRHLDLRWAHDESQLDRRHSRFRDAIAELAAPMHGRSKDDLESEDIRRHRGAVRLAWATGITIFALLIVALVAGGLARTNANRADDRAKAADSQRLAAQSEQNADRPDLSFLLAAQAYAIDPTLQAEAAVLRALQVDGDLRRFVRGHDDEVWAVAIVPEHDLIASGTASGTISLTHRVSGATVFEYATDAPSPVIALVPTGDDALMAIDAAGRMIRFDLSPLNRDSDQLDVSIERVGSGDGTLQVAAINPAGTEVAVGSVDGRLVVASLEDLENPMYDLSISDVDVIAAGYSPDGSRLATGTAAGTLAVRDAATGAVIWGVADAHTGSNSALTALEFSADGATLATVGANGGLQLWDVDSGTPLGPDGGMQGAHTGELWDVTYTGAAFPGFDGPYIATAGEDGRVVYWNPDTLTPLSDANQVHVGALNEVFFATDGSFATAGSDRVVGYFETDATRIASGERRDIGAPVAMVGLSPDGETLAVASGPEGEINLWAVAEREPTGAATTAGVVVQDVEFDPTGRWLAGALEGGGILIWDTERDVADTIDAHRTDVINVEFSADGARLLSTAPLADEVKVWDFDAGALSESVTIDDIAFPRGGAFSPDSRYAAFGIGQGGDVGLYDLDVPSAEDRSLQVLSVGDGTLDATWEVAFHPAEPLLASVGGDSQVHVWDLDTLEESGEPLIGHDNATGDVVFLGDGDRMLTASEDGTVRLWDLERREPIGSPLVGHDGIVFGVAADSSGLAAVSGSSDGTVIFWDLDVDDWIAQGCALVGRDLTDSERHRFDLEHAPAPC